MTSVDALLEIMVRLRDPDDGCPWDVEQTFATIAPYTLEEAYEVDHAIQRGDMRELCDELGDLLLQVVFHAQMADEAGHFAFSDVVQAICQKLVRRHPHVFGGANDPALPHSSQDQTRLWEEIKAEERAARADGRGDGEARPGLFDGIPIALPALSRAIKLRKRVATAAANAATSNAHAERTEATHEIQSALVRIEGQLQSQRQPGDDEAEKVQREIGRLLSACVDLSRALGVDPELALRTANRDFEQRVESDREGEAQ